MKKLAMLLFVLILTLVSMSTGFAEQGKPIIESNPASFEEENRQLTDARAIIGDYEAYGTFYVDKDRSFVLAIAKPDAGTDRIAKALKDKFSAQKVQIKIAKYATKELKKVSSEIYASFSELESAGSNLVSTSIDEALGKVVVEAKAMRPETQNKLQQKYGDILDIRVDAATPEEVETISRTDNFPVIGGGIATSGFCTLTATAKKGTERYIITAGHCLSGNGTTDIYQFSTKVGVDWAKAVSHDIGLIKVTESGRKISNKILRNSTTAYDYKYTATANVTQGSSYCKAGMATGYTCSEVISTSYNGLYQDTIKLKNPNWAFQDNGDSGAPLFSSLSVNYVLFGIMSTKSSTNDANAFATATKISYLNHYWSDYTLYTSDTDY
ncbi:S1 family peptidase [Cohnella yongneupensis]|uniref:S1 family peptidase n=1 Tax=Cohnella yongneupensis TaxID=425006 RepID=A0ABW0QXQ8_9BACL